LSNLDRRLQDLEHQAARSSKHDVVDHAAARAALYAKFVSWGLSASAEEAEARGYESRAAELAEYAGMTQMELQAWLKERARQ
jgi:predicted metallo-beta-lactamase superfamily hydrolase